MEPLGRIYSAGIADFANLRQMKCIYADKTDLVYRLANECRYAFLSRPRRFGKSLLCSTLKYYFLGRKDLFAGFAIESLEKEWAEYPVLHFDLSLCKNKETIEEIRGELHDQINRCERDCGLKAEGEAPGQRLKNLVETLYKTGKQVEEAILLDGIDKAYAGRLQTYVGANMTIKDPYDGTLSWLIYLLNDRDAVQETETSAQTEQTEAFTEGDYGDFDFDGFDDAEDDDYLSAEDLKDSISAMHFHYSDSWEYRRSFRERTYEGGLITDFILDAYKHISTLDRHLPYTNKRCNELVEVIEPELLIHELPGR